MSSPSRVWWYVPEGATEAEQIECEERDWHPPGGKGWWCPSLMLPLIEGVHLFPTEVEALEAAQDEAWRKYVAAEARCHALAAARALSRSQAGHAGEEG